MAFVFFKKDIVEQKLLSWASAGLLIFVSAFLWAPSRDGLQGIYYLAFFLPMALLLLTRKPNFTEYGGWMTVTALTYAGFSTISALWSDKPSDIGFFIFQWCVLAAWLCGSSLLFSRRDIDLQKYIIWFLVIGACVTLSMFYYYYYFVDSQFTFALRLVGWNVFRNPNEIGAMCGVLALLSIIFAFQSKKLKYIYLFYSFTLVAGIGLAASFSRSALLAFLLMSFVAFVMIRPALKAWLPLAIFIFVSIAGLVIFTNFVAGFDGRKVAIDERFFVWKEAIYRGQDNLIIGAGITVDSRITLANGAVFNHAHNAWLDTFYRTGLIGLLLVLIHLISVLKHASANTSLLPMYLWLGYGCLCSLFDSRCFFWEIGAKWFLYWIPIGLLVAAHTGMVVRRRIKVIGD